jgi:hypothetical protein
MPLSSEDKNRENKKKLIFRNNRREPLRQKSQIIIDDVTGRSASCNLGQSKGFHQSSASTRVEEAQ